MSLRIQIASDWHLEFHRDFGRSFLAGLDPTGVDVLVLAGDLLSAQDPVRLTRTYQCLARLFPHVILVPGNHEYYHCQAAETDRTVAQAAQAAGLHLLNPGMVTLAGQRFVGATLWFPWDSTCTHYMDMMNDFSVIRGFRPWVYDKHEADLQFLDQNTGAGDIVVTHHLPSVCSVPHQFTGSALNRFFVAQEAQGVMEKRKPRYWIHGHTHTPCRYIHQDTEVICNPLGYPGEARVRYEEKLIIQV